MSLVKKTSSKTKNEKINKNKTKLFVFSRIERDSGGNDAKTWEKAPNEMVPLTSFFTCQAFSVKIYSHKSFFSECTLNKQHYTNIAYIFYCFINIANRVLMFK